MNKRDVAEIKRRFKKDAETFTRIACCYVNAEKQKITSFEENFSSLEEDEYYKYLEIAKKVLSGKVEDNILTLRITDDDKKKSLLAVKHSRLKQVPVLDTFFDAIIENLCYTGNYLIVLFHDVYDVVKRHSDGTKDAEFSDDEETFEYIIGAVCPVKLSKPGLGYRESENKIGARIRDWVVDAPMTGFMYPAFTDRSGDEDSIVFYNKNTKEPHTELSSNVYGAKEKYTATVKRDIMKRALEHTVEDVEETDLVYSRLQQTIEDELDEKEAEEQPDIVELLQDCGVKEQQAKEVVSIFSDEIDKEDTTSLQQLYDSNAAKQADGVIVKGRLKEENEKMRDLLERAKQELEQTGSSQSLVVEIETTLRSISGKE